MKRLAILLSTYNGERYITEQIDSLIQQDLFQNNQYEIELVVRDDGSKDQTLKIVSQYSGKIQTTIIEGNNLGAAQSFWELIHLAPEADYYAFCDQDDVWNKDKLSRAIRVLEYKNPNIPQLYCSDFQWADKELKPISVYQKEYPPYTDFPHALLYSLSPGCTYVFNWEALLKARKYDFSKEHVEIHDWLLFKIVAMLGDITYDSEKTLLYRQHGDNTIGSKNEGFSGFIERTHRFLTSNAGLRSETAKSLMRVYQEELSELPDQKYYVNLVANYKKNKEAKINFIKESSFARDKSDILRRLLIIFNKI